MEKVVENMVMSHSAPMQTTCKNLLVDFLLTYPMTTDSVEHFIHFLVKNLSYEDSSGRLLVVQALRLILQRFDPQIIDHYALVIYYSLIVQYLNEEHPLSKT